MIKSETKLRVRYGETDQMGYAYYGVYAQYYEVGRVDAMRSLGFSYKDMEAQGILMPVIDYTINYKKPAFYDDEITIVTKLNKLPTGVRIVFDYECYNSNKELLNTGKVTLVFIEKETKKMCKIPDWFIVAMRPFFDAKS
ncbi:MAG: thioesterase family protein [Bacteroidota bacterium]|nr:thioesterase family protein [Bacteroidota bacterium]